MVMSACVAELARALRRRNSPAAAATPRPSNAEVSANHLGDQHSESSEPQAPTLIEVTGGDAQATTDPVEIAPSGSSPVVKVGANSPAVGTVVEVAPDAGELSKSKKRKRKNKHRNKSKSKSPSQFSKCSSKRSEH
ncbi:hypothetical protein Salat_0644600 [Sesamum alatum]|uniref:Uncharacterized protein n=1 Tax=Sesamum alatum TaxID=300844 RepID=A0AAE1YRF3_9LAMI|nr:hypothetical protein Salat_0644600 [Sesamum alatum]